MGFWMGFWMGLAVYGSLVVLGMGGVAAVVPGGQKYVGISMASAMAIACSGLVAESLIKQEEKS